MAPPYFFFLLVALISVPAASLASSYVVGGDVGWTLPSLAKINYEQWAASITFKVGDYIVFNYAKRSHGVLEVIRSDYRYCNTSNPIASFQDGKTVIELSKPGSYYFISGVSGHCKAGQKFQLKVLDGSAADITPALVPAMAPSPESITQAIPPPLAAAETLRISSVIAPAAFSLLGFLFL